MAADAPVPIAPDRQRHASGFESYRGAVRSASVAGQVLILTLFGAVIGALLANLVASFILATVPFSLANGVFVYGMVLMIVEALGALLSADRIARIDPLIAIGRVE